MIGRQLTTLSLLWATRLALTTTFLPSTTAVAFSIPTPLADHHLKHDAAARSSSNTTGPSFSAFVQQTVYGNISFAVTAVRESGDLWIHFEGPSGNSWVAVGTGGSMKGSLMWIIYKNGNERGVTLSPRIADGNREPTYDSDIPCDIDDLDGPAPSSTTDRNGNSFFAVNVHCRNVHNRTSFARSTSDTKPDVSSDGKLDFDNPSQNFIFALGPTDRHLHDDSKEANIRRHSMYGRFTLDLRAATVSSPLDVDKEALAQIGTLTMKDARLEGEPRRDRDWGGGVHSVLMCGTFVILFPLGFIFLRVLEKVEWHAIMQTVGLVLILAGMGLGIWLGREYNHSQQIRSPHQLLGLTISALIILQFGLGLSHHLIYIRTHNQTVLGRIHTFLGPAVLVFGAANGFLGFRFSGGSYHNIMYGIIVAVVLVVLTGLVIWAGKRNKSRIRMGVVRRGQGRVGDEAYEAFKHQGSGQEREGDGPFSRVVEMELETRGEGRAWNTGEAPDGPPPYEGTQRVQTRTMV